LERITEQQLTKLYYSIGEVAAMFDVNTSLIRFWEKEFSAIKLKKNKKGNRLFTPKDVLKIDRIYHLVKERGYTLDGAQKAMKHGAELDSKASTENLTQEVIIRLEKLKRTLMTLKS
jgi:DNA-binding transcriptional MerR regulator